MTEMLVPAIAELPNGVLRTALPTPFPVGDVNCYLVLGSPVAVIDPGMIWQASTDRIEAFLAEAGLRVGDVESVVVTHGHPDHFGAAGWLAGAADAPILCGRAELSKLSGDFGRLRGTSLATTLGIPDELTAGFGRFYEVVKDLTSPIDPGRLRPVDDGDRLELGSGSWIAHVTPGHAAGHLSLQDVNDGVLISGDHLLGHITPNPVIEPDLELPGGRRRSLSEYLASLDRFAAMDPQLVLPGHGEAFSDVPGLVEITRAHHADRATDVLALVEHLGTPTAFEVAVALFPQLEGFSHMLGVSEALGHLDLLEDDGRVTQVDGPTIRYRAS